MTTLNKLKVLYRSGLNLLVNKLRIVFGINKYLVNFYYAFLNLRFSHEHYSFNAAIRAYNKNTFSIEIYVRRNIHRIEKGLISKKPKDIFAEGYVLQTVATLAELMEKGFVPGSINYYLDVLREYFKRVNYAKSSSISKAKLLFEQIETSNNQIVDKQQIPYNFKEKNTLISYNDILKFAKDRHSVRYFDNKKVPEKVIMNALDIAREAPSGCNRQAFKYYVIDDIKFVKEKNILPPGAFGFSSGLQNIIYIVVNQSAFNHERDKHINYVDGSLSLMSFVFAIESLGLGSCILHWPDTKEYHSNLKKALQLEEYQVCISTISIGYPASKQKIPYSCKRSVNEIVEFVDATINLKH